MASPEATLREAIALESGGDPVAAELVLRRACRTWRGEAEFAIRHAALLMRLGQAKRALKRYRKVMKSHPQRLEASIGAAEAAQLLGKHKMAESIYARAMALGMHGDEAALGIAASLLARGKRKRAWDTAFARFETSGHQHRGLHDLLMEIAPHLGKSVPPMEVYDTPDTSSIEARKPVAVVHEATSMEALAGIQATDLVATSADDPMATLLGDDENVRGSSTVPMDLPADELLRASPAEVPEDVLEFDL